MRISLTAKPVDPHPVFGSSYRETNCKFNRPNPDRDYIRILACCTGDKRKVTEIYRRVKNPVLKMLRDMCREGLLKRFTDGKRDYYTTTKKGFDLLCVGCRR